MEYLKIRKTPNVYRFEPDYINFQKTNLEGLTIDSIRLDQLKTELFKKFNYDLVAYSDIVESGRFGLATLAAVDKTYVAYPVIKEFEKEKIDSFAVRSFRPARFGGHIEVKVRYKNGGELEFFQPRIRNIRADIWDWCVKKYVIDPMTGISNLTGIPIGELIEEFTP